MRRFGLKRPDQQEPADLWIKHYEMFTRLYRGREDIIALQQDDGQYVDLKGEGLTFPRFLDHVHLRKTYAIYNMDDTKRVHFGLFDLDVVNRQEGWGAVRSGIEEKRKESLRIMKTLLDLGLSRRNMLVEFPTVGFHIVFFFKHPVAAKAVKAMMQEVLQKSGLTHIPFYPRRVEESRYGDRVQLPLRINLNTSKRSNFVRDLEHFDPEHYDETPDFVVLEEVDPIDASWISRWGQEGVGGRA